MIYTKKNRIRHITSSLLMLMASVTQLPAQVNFSSPQQIITGSIPNAVAVGDVNNDGLKDVVVGLGGYFDPANDFSIKVYLQTNNGLSINPRQYPYPTGYPGLRTMVVGDVNGDSLNDVIIGRSDSVSIYYQNAITGTLNPVQSWYAGAIVTAIQTGDINNDGRMDIAVCFEDVERVRLFYNTGSNTFDTASVYKPVGGSGNEIKIGDVNGDGLNDVVCGNSSRWVGLYVYTQTVQGTLNPYVRYRSPTIRGVRGLDIKDLNGDGLLDIVESKGGNHDARIVLWYQDPCSGSLLPPIELQALDIPGSIEARDMNCDGHPEIITAHPGFRSVTVFEQDSLGQYMDYRSWRVRSDNSYSQSLDVGDLNNDDKDDIVVVDNIYGLHILYNLSTPDTNLYTVQQSQRFTDTVSTLFRDSLYTFSSTQRDTLHQLFVVTQKDSFQVRYTFREDTVRHTRIDFTTATQCGYSYADTLVTLTDDFYSQRLSEDTIVRYTKRDTIALLPPPDTLAETLSIEIYPNPVRTLLYIELPAALKTQAIEIRIRDIHGKWVRKSQLNGKESIRPLEVGELPVGVYIIDFYIGPEHVRKKIIRF